jgi:hypothetical protein
MPETQSSQVRLENRTEHVLHLTLAGGAIISVPPSPEDAPAPMTVTFKDAEERARFEQALTTETVQQWLKDKHLVVHGAGAAPEATGGEQGSSTAGGEHGGSAPTSPSVPTTPSTPGSKRRGAGE